MPWTGIFQRAPIVVGILALALYVVTLCPTVPFGDGGELIAASAAFGVAHPPGYPLYTALGRLALSLFPFDEPAVPMNLLSAIFAALACAAVARLAHRLTDSLTAAYAAGGCLAVSATPWSIATVTEVYGLHLFLLTGLLVAAQELGTVASAVTRGRRLVLCGLLLGLGLSHHPTIVIALPAALVLGLRRRSDGVPIPRRGLALAGLAVVLLPALAYGTLIVRSRLDPVANWSDPSSIARMIPHATAAVYRHLDLGWAGLFRPDGWGRLGGLLTHELTPLALPFALLAFVRRGRGRWAVAALIGAGSLFGLRYVTDDFQVFFLPTFVGLALAVGLGVATIDRAGSRLRHAAAILAAVLLIATPLATHWNTNDTRGMTAAKEFGRDVLAAVPQGGVLFVIADEAFPLLYLVQVLGERPDVSIYHREGLFFRDVTAELELPRAEGESDRAYRLRSEQAFIGRALFGPNPREVAFLGWPGYETPPEIRLEPVGLVVRMARADAAPRDPDPIWARCHEERVREQALRRGGAYASAVAANYSLAKGERALFEGDRGRAERHFEQASRVGGGSSWLLSHLGTVYGREGDYARAIELFRRAIERTPTNYQAWNNLALALERSGERDAARRALIESLAVAPDQADARARLRTLGD